MQVTFLSAALPLVKKFVRTPSGIDKTPYPMVARFTSHVEQVDSIETFHRHLLRHATQGDALYKGMLDQQLDNESRAGHTLIEATTQWICLDFDGMTAFDNIQNALTALKVSNVDHIIQWSASQFLKDGLNAHVFMRLSDPADPQTFLKRWLKYLNLNTPALKADLELTKSFMALRWPLDITVNQNDKLLYIGDPIFKGMEDPFAGKSRIELVKGRQATLDLSSMIEVVSAANVEHDERELIAELRKRAGLRKISPRITFNKALNATVMSNPNHAVVTGVKEARGFVYLNINGGDSWGYFHPSDNPDVIYNFKGEPAYPADKFIPEYYESAAAARKKVQIAALEPKNEGKNPQYFVFNDKPTGRRYKAEFDPNTREIGLYPAPTEKHIEDFCVLKGIGPVDVIPDWTIVFDPTSNVVVDEGNRTINRYKPSRYWLNSFHIKPHLDFTDADTVLSEVPPAYRDLIIHIAGGDRQCTAYFLNWLAFVWQYGEKTKTAWIFHGTQGTGKNNFELVLAELFGRDQVNEITVEAMQETLQRNPRAHTNLGDQ